MTPDERNLISGLFDRLRTADTQAKDAEAAQFIQSKVGEQPTAPYLLTQTVLVQEHALSNAQARISQLERQLADAAKAQPQQSGGFLSGLFGHQSPAPAPAPAYAPPQAQPVAYPSTVNMAPSAGGGFLRGALTTAAGVAGGALLFQGIEDLLGHRAGVFGGGLGGFGGGFGGGSEVIENNEVVNNYYGGAENPPSNFEQSSSGGDGGGFDQGNVGADTIGTDAGFDGGSSNDTSFLDSDSSSSSDDSFGGGGGDSSDSLV